MGCSSPFNCTWSKQELWGPFWKHGGLLPYQINQSPSSSEPFPAKHYRKGNGGEKWQINTIKSEIAGFQNKFILLSQHCFDFRLGLFFKPMFSPNWLFLVFRTPLRISNRMLISLTCFVSQSVLQSRSSLLAITVNGKDGDEKCPTSVSKSPTVPPDSQLTTNF